MFYNINSLSTRYYSISSPKPTRTFPMPRDITYTYINVKQMCILYIHISLYLQFVMYLLVLFNI